MTLFGLALSSVIKGSAGGAMKVGSRSLVLDRVPFNQADTAIGPHLFVARLKKTMESEPTEWTFLSGSP